MRMTKPQETATGRDDAGTILVSDIGSTNARFALAERDGTLHHIRHYALADFASADVLMARYLEEIGTQPYDALCLALAGPVQGRTIRLSNAPLAFDADRLAKTTGRDDVVLINDFEAVANAVPHLPSERLRPLGDVPPAAGVKAVLGPGTGLGTAILVPSGNDWIIVACEGGHAAFAPKDSLEVELTAILMRELPYVSWETFLSGPGLVRLYGAVCELWGCAPKFDAPRAITTHAIDASDPVCHQTLEVFCAMLGNAAGSLALTAGARGGVYVAGGIPPQIYDFLAASHFRERFDNHGALSNYCRQITVNVIDDPALGLHGALHAYLRRRE
jgi:glucokinase